MKKIFRASLLAGLFFLVACGQNHDVNSEGQVDVPMPIEVKLDVLEKAEVDEVVTISTTVKQGEDLVDDANEVIFEIWKEGAGNKSEMLQASEQEGHVYRLAYSFAEEGTYDIKAHVTAREMHRMPSAQIQIGEQTTEAKHEHIHQDHHAKVEITQEITDTQLILTVNYKEEPFHGGNVTLEMWKDEEEQHQWIDVKEYSPGVYKLETIESLKGLYSATIHIKNESVHEHIETELNF